MVPVGARVSRRAHNYLGGVSGGAPTARDIKNQVFVPGTCNLSLFIGYYHNFYSKAILPRAGHPAAPATGEYRSQLKKKDFGTGSMWGRSRNCERAGPADPARRCAVVLDTCDLPEPFPRELLAILPHSCSTGATITHSHTALVAPERARAQRESVSGLGECKPVAYKG